MSLRRLFLLTILGFAALRGHGEPLSSSALPVSAVPPAVSADAAAKPVSPNQADKNLPLMLDVWKYKMDMNRGVHAWVDDYAGMFVFQEWITVLMRARAQGPEASRRAGLALEKYVVDGRIKPFGVVGTTVPLPGFADGDFDMTLLGCTSLLGLFAEDRVLLTDKTLMYLIVQLSHVWGQTPKAYFDIAFVSMPETENHLFMSESTRYLTNQLIFDNARKLPQMAALRDSLVRAGVVIDNREGMLKRLLLKMMQKTMKNGFFEFNAQIYQRFTIQALDNLYSFAGDTSVSDGAGCLLDYLSALFAFQSYDAVRYGPFRRSSEVYQDSSLIANDASCSFFAVQSGAFPWVADPRRGLWRTYLAHAGMALYSTVLKYRVPDPILAYMGKRDWEYRAEIASGYAGSGSRKRPTETYYGAPKYLLTAGGRYEPYSGPNFPTPSFWFSDAPWVYDVITRSSSLLLDPKRDQPRSLADILHFKGTQWRANNMAVRRGFLYGYSPVDAFNSPEWPQSVPAKWAIDRKGAGDGRTWTTRDFDFRFLDRSDAGVYIVLGRLRPADTYLKWNYQKYLRGTIEVIDTARVHSLAELRELTLARNSPQGRWPLGPRRYVYVDFSGARIHLNPRYDGDNDGIVRVEEQADSAGSETTPALALPFRFPWLGDKGELPAPAALAGFFGGESPARPLFQVDLFAPWKGKAALSDGEGNMYVFNPADGGYCLVNFREWWNPRRKIGN